MTKRLWLGIGAIVLVVGGWLGYRQLVPPTQTVGSLIPPGALMILASDRLQDTIPARVLRTQMSIRQVPVFDEARQRLNRFLYATADSATVLKFISGRNVRYSLHSISKSTLDFIFYVPITSNDQEFLNRVTTPNPRQFRVLSHTFADEKIRDLVSRDGEPIGSFILTDNFLIGSVSGILIENVAKRMHQSLKLNQDDPVINGPAFRSDAQLQAGVSVRPEVLQSLFSNVGSLVRLFLPEQLTLQFRQSAAHTHLIGYSVDEIGERRDVAALFANQNPQRIQHPHLIPQTTATLYHISVSDATRFGQSLRDLLGSASSDFLRDRFSLLEPITPALYASLGSDLLLCRLESPTGTLRQILILTAQNGKQLANSYQQAAYRAGARNMGQPKTYLGHKLLQLNVSELPASLFSSLFLGFSQSWITQHGTSLIVGNSEEALQDYLQQVQRGAIWTTDQRQAEFLKATLRPANFTAFVRLNRAETTVPRTWPLAWQNLLDRIDPATGTTALSNLENMAYQASYGNENIQSTVVLGRTTRRASKMVLNKLLLQKKTEFNAPLISAPIVTGNLSDSSAQFYAQNNAGQFVLVTPQGDKIVQSNIDGPIRSNALGVDFLNNGRLQYLFMTDRTLYVADPVRISKEVTLQSIPLPQGIDTSYLARPRGSQQRNFVALAAHHDGHIYALDRQRRAFVRIMTAPRKSSPQLPFQVIPTEKGMDVLMIQKDGTLNYWRENGSQYPHFPSRIERKNEDEAVLSFSGPALLPPNQSLIQTIADEGQLFTINLNGLIAKRTQLYRPVRSDKFRLFPDEDQTNWLLLRTTDTELTVLDQQGQRRFDVRALQSGRNNVRYHRLGAGVELISVKSGGFTTLYDMNGRIIGDRPIPSDFPVALQFDERTNELYILSGAQQAVQLFRIRIR
ncbi:hypothetical protein IC229_28310 [Spirosoma sp. BT702]|uniref:Uncharacterized protein n=1 Tax=Spirosoma profusum TaxID=2771354 RepID=A0A927ASX8_9BACT|nr:hypothetical protein [Spirosoma profusum]MBD2704578.1 hypothetical protein [Spirosoma profusum]